MINLTTYIPVAILGSLVIYGFWLNFKDSKDPITKVGWTFLFLAFVGLYAYVECYIRGMI